MLRTVSSQQKEMHSLEFNQQQDFYLEMPESETKIPVHFKISFPKLEEGSEFMLIVKPMDFSTDPDVLLSNTTEFPDYTQNQYQCNALGLEICTVPNEMLKKNENTTIYATVYCYHNCSFLIKAYNQKEQQLELDYSQHKLVHYHNFTKDQSEILKIKIPKNDLIETMVISALIQNIWDVQETFYMYLTKGNEIPSTNNFDVEGITLGSQSKSIELVKNYVDEGQDNVNKLCTDCTLNLLIVAPLKSVIKLKIKYSGATIPMNFYEYHEDLVLKGQQKNFVLKADENQVQRIKKNYLSLQFVTYLGEVEIYMHYDSQPKQLEQYKWKLKDVVSEEFILSLEDRQEAKASDRHFYITVVGKQKSSFLLYFTIGFQQISFIKSEQLYAGLIKNNQLMSFYYVYKEKSLENITVKLTSDKGGVELYVKQCNLRDSNIKKKCDITHNSIEEIKNKKINNILFDDNIQSNHNYITINPDKNQCKIYPVESYCGFQVTVLGNNSNKNLTNFNLFIQTPNRRTKIYEGQPFKDWIGYKQNKYYEFVNLADVSKITIVVTVINGQIELFSDRQKKSFEDKDYEQQVFHPPYMIEYEKKNYETNKQGLKGSYYLKIYGQENSLYTIKIILSQEKADKRLQHLIILKQDELQHYTIRNFTEDYIFQFKNDQQKDAEKINNIGLHMTPISGKYNLYLSAGQLPTNTSYQIKTSNNQIMIDSKSEFFQYSAKYYLLVEPILLADSKEKFEFYIQYYTSQSIQDIKIGLPFQQIFQQQSQILHYKILISKEEAEKGVEISLKNINFNSLQNQSIEAFFSINQNNYYPNFENSDIQLLNSSAQLTFNVDQVKKGCSFLWEQEQLGSKQCFIYMTLSSSQKSQRIFILAQIKNSATKLLDGQALFFQSPFLNEFQNLYFQIPDNQNISFYIYSAQGGYSIYCKVFKMESLKEQVNKWPFPTKENFDFEVKSELSSSTQSLYINQEQIKQKNCEKDCMLLLQVLQNKQILHQSQITVIVSTKFMHLMSGVPIKSTVQAKSIQYFDLNVDDSDTETIIISATTLSGAPYLVVSYGSDSLPNHNHYDWNSKYYMSDSIIITKQSNKKVEKSLQGIYRIGIYAVKQSQFMITASFGQFQVIDLIEGFPQQAITTKQPIYFIFQNYYKSDLKIIFTKIMGNFEYALNHYKYSNQVINYIPTLNKNLLSSQKLDSDMKSCLRIPVSNNKLHCSHCNYIIGIFPETQPSKESIVKMEIVAVSENQTLLLSEGKQIRDFVQKQKQNIYKIFYMKDDIIQINVEIISGNITIYLGNSDVSTEKYQFKYQKNQNQSSIIILYETKDQKDKDQQYLYLLVDNKENQESQYSIGFIKEHLSSRLDLGKKLSGYLEVEKIQKYFFISDVEKLEKKNMQIIISVYNEWAYQNQTIQDKKKLFPQVNIQLEKWEEINFNSTDSVPINQSKIQVNIQKSFIYENLIYYEFQQEKGKYYIEVINSDGNETINRDIKLQRKPTNYSIQTMNTELTTIQPSQNYFGIVPASSTSYFEMFHNENRSKLLIQIGQCLGKVTLQYSSSEKDIKNGLYEREVRFPTNNFMVAVIDLQKNPVFFSVKSIEGVDTSSNNDQPRLETAYSISTKLYNENYMIPYDQFYLGDKGRVQWKFTGQNKALIKIQPVQCLNQCHGSLIEATEFKYTVYYSENLNVIDSQSQCGLDMDYMLKKKTNSTQKVQLQRVQYKAGSQPMVISFELDNIDQFNVSKPIFLAVKAQVSVREKESLEEEEFTFFYETIEFYRQVKQKTSYNWYIIVLILGAVVILIIVLINLAKKYDYVKKRLYFEQQDVRNIAYSSSTEMSTHVNGKFEKGALIDEA